MHQVQLKQVEVTAIFDDNYAQHAAVMLVSLLKHASRFGEHMGDLI